MYLILKGEVPIYVGKGTEDRVKDSLVERDGDSYLIVFRTDFEDEAYAVEDQLYLSLHQLFELLNFSRPGVFGKRMVGTFKHRPDSKIKLSQKIKLWHRSRSVEEKKKANLKMSQVAIELDLAKSLRKWFSELTTEQKLEYKRKQVIGLKLASEKMSISAKKRYSNPTIDDHLRRTKISETLSKKSESQREHAKKWWENLSPEQKQSHIRASLEGRKKRP